VLQGGASGGEKAIKVASLRIEREGFFTDGVCRSNLRGGHIKSFGGLVSDWGNKSNQKEKDTKNAHCLGEPRLAQRVGRGTGC